ncbi:hypothetical protein NSR98_25465, partial [Salmonella enterica]|nr:hypothetical protein [Salmonella enterica]
NPPLSPAPRTLAVACIRVNYLSAILLRLFSSELILTSGWLFLLAVIFFFDISEERRGGHDFVGVRVDNSGIGIIKIMVGGGAGRAW